MTIKVELLLDVDDKSLELYKGDPRNVPQIICDELNMFYKYGGVLGKIIMAEASSDSK